MAHFPLLMLKTLKTFEGQIKPIITFEIKITND